MHYLWDVVAHVERVVHYVIKSNGLIPYDQLDSETLSALRWEVFHTMDEMIRQEEFKRQKEALGRLMFGIRR